ncbi:MAG: enoyl-CoA hydratase/isomerase family protein [Phycisphaerales bacterium]
MPNDLVQLGFEDSIAMIALNDPDRRNAMNIAMFDALDEAVRDVAVRNDVHVLLLHGKGKAFCSGFDLAAAVDDPTLMKQYIDRLSATIRTLRRLPQVVVGAVHGAAIAGGCAMVSACDIVVASATAKFGYPVHKLGVSPAVNITTLAQAIGPGPARSLLMSSELIDGTAVLRLGLAHRLVETDDAVLDAATSSCRTIAGHGPKALRVTKAWLNELDGSLDDDLFDGPRDGSAEIADSDEAVALLRQFRAGRK